MTNLVYSLIIFNDRLEGFFIGLFESSEKARQVAEHYLSALPGFRDYPCTYEITEKLVVGTIGQSQKIYMIWGWDEDEEGDETDVWSSACYADLSEAQRAMGAAKRRMNKQLGYLPDRPVSLDGGLYTSLLFRIRAIKYIYVHNGNICTKIFREEI